MKRIHYFTLLLSALLFEQCNHDYVEKEKGTTSFLFNQNNSTGKFSTDQVPSFALISVQDVNGNVVCNSKLLSLFQFGSEFTSENVLFDAGEYKLTQFLILNSQKQVLYACPFEGSDYSQYVNDPLPINFIVNAAEETKVIPQVVEVTSDITPQSFGYTNFGFEIVTIPNDNFKIKIVDDQLYDSVTFLFKNESTIVKKKIDQGEVEVSFLKSDLQGIGSWDMTISAYSTYPNYFPEEDEHDFYEMRINADIDISDESAIYVEIDNHLILTLPNSLSFASDNVNYLHFYKPGFFHFELNAETPCDPHFKYQIGDAYTCFYLDRYLYNEPNSTVVYYSYVQQFAPFNFDNMIDASDKFGDLVDICNNGDSWTHADALFQGNLPDGTFSVWYYAWTKYENGRLKKLSSEEYSDLLMLRKRSIK